MEGCQDADALLVDIMRDFEDGSPDVPSHYRRDVNQRLPKQTVASVGVSAEESSKEHQAAVLIVKVSLPNQQWKILRSSGVAFEC